LRLSGKVESVMSKHETPLTRKYWNEIGGILIEEFPAVLKGVNHSQRLMDGIILLGEQKKIASWKNIEIKGKDIVVIQTKASRLGMNVMGQAFFSIELMKKYHPKSIKSVIVCNKDDEVLRPIAEMHGLEVKVYI
jgi:hypothetical protein